MLHPYYYSQFSTRWLSLRSSLRIILLPKWQRAVLCICSQIGSKGWGIRWKSFPVTDSVFLFSCVLRLLRLFWNWYIFGIRVTFYVLTEWTHIFLRQSGKEITRSMYYIPPIYLFNGCSSSIINLISENHITLPRKVGFLL